MNVEQARFNMIEQQIRPWDVLDPKVLNLLSEVKREDFVPEVHRALAFADLEIPIGYGQTMLPPRVEARLLQDACVKRSESVLEIGTGTGYMAALLGACADRVVSVEINEELAAKAKNNLAAAGIHNVTVEVGNAAQGWSEHAPYDVIMVSASLPEVPSSLLGQLSIGGRLVAIVGREPVMLAQLITCTAEGRYSAINLFETVVLPLTGFEAEPAFSF